MPDAKRSEQTEGEWAQSVRNAFFMVDIRTLKVLKHYVVIKGGDP